eukprot:6470696-Amphidinium_carterae.1
MGIAFWHAVAAVLAVSHGKDPYCWVNGRTWDRCCGDTGSQHEDSMSNSCWSGHSCLMMDPASNRTIACLLYSLLRL